MHAVCNEGEEMIYRMIAVCFLCLAVPALPAHAVGDAEYRGKAHHIEGDMIGTAYFYSAQYEDSLYRIARRFGLGIVEILAANPGVDRWMPEPGSRIRLSTAHILPAAPREGIVINLPELRLYYFDGPDRVYSFPIGIGKEGWQTPTGKTTIVRKRENPVWIPPDSIRQKNPDLPNSIPAGPDNPLGTHALNMGWPRYVIHGTNQPYGIGRRSSHGCIRLYPEDIPVLFNRSAAGTKVTVVDQPYKIGWYKDTVLLEVSPTQQQSDEILEHGRILSSAPVGNAESALSALDGKEAVIDWPAVEKALRERRGVPVPVGHRLFQ